MENLEGSIPAEIGNLKNLKALYVIENILRYFNPLECRKLHTNKLSGSIPTEIGALINLEVM